MPILCPPIMRNLGGCGKGADLKSHAQPAYHPPTDIAVSTSTPPSSTLAVGERPRAHLQLVASHACSFVQLSRDLQGHTDDWMTGFPLCPSPDQIVCINISTFHRMRPHPFKRTAISYRCLLCMGNTNNAAGLKKRKLLRKPSFHRFHTQGNVTKQPRKTISSFSEHAMQEDYRQPGCEPMHPHLAPKKYFVRLSIPLRPTVGWKHCGSSSPAIQRTCSPSAHASTRANSSSVNTYPSLWGSGTHHQHTPNNCQYCCHTIPTSFISASTQLHIKPLKLLKQGVDLRLTHEANTSQTASAFFPWRSLFRSATCHLLA